LIAGLEFEGKVLGVLAGRRRVEKGSEEFGGVVEGGGEEYVASFLEGCRVRMVVVEGRSGQQGGDLTLNCW